MDHRWNKRHDFSADIMVYYSPLGLLRGSAVNISREGMFIQTQSVSLPRYAPVEIAFQLPDMDSMMRLRALVVHNQEKGVGLMFRELNTKVCDAMNRLLKKLEQDNNQAPAFAHHLASEAF